MWVYQAALKCMMGGRPQLFLDPVPATAWSAPRLPIVGLAIVRPTV